MSSRKSSPLPQGRFLLWISTIWCDRNGGVKLYQYDRNESRRSVSMVGSHHPWIEPGRQGTAGVVFLKLKQFAHFLKGCCDGNLFQHFFCLFKGQFFYPDLDLMETWDLWSDGLSSWCSHLQGEFWEMWYPSQWKQQLHTQNTVQIYG